MPAATLDDFMAWNDELYALAQAGVPIDVDLGQAGTDAVAALERINASVARRVTQGASLAEAVQGNSQVVTPAYSALVQTGLRSGDLAAALAGSNRTAASLDDLSHAVRLSVLYPLIVCSLAYLGLIAFCLFFFPTIDDLHRDLRLPSGPGLRSVRALRESLPYWGAIPPLLLVFLAIWQLGYSSRPGLSRRRSARLLAWLPGVSRAIEEQRYANFADSLATLLSAGTPLDEALPLATGEAAVAVFPASPPPEPSFQGEEGSSSRLPPFLRFALWRSEEGVGRVRALRMAAELYRASAQRRADRVRLIAPLVLCAVVGGGATLLYGLALFVPVIEMLHSLAT